MLGGRPRDKFREDAPAHSAHRGEGADVIKVFAFDNRTGKPDYTLEELTAIVEEADGLGRAVAARAKTYEGVRNAVLAGVDTIEHGPPEVYRT